MFDVFNLEEYLPFYNVTEEGHVLVKDGVAKPRHRSDHSRVESISNSSDCEGGMDWLNNQTFIGSVGEEAAFEYLTRRFSEQRVDMVSNNARLGYDIAVSLETGKEGYEIKTSGDKKLFHITYNELKVALKMLDKYNLFFIVVSWPDQKAYAYIINNPITHLGLDFNYLTRATILDKVSIVPDQFIVSFADGYLQSLERIDLSDYSSIRKLWEQT